MQPAFVKRVLTPVHNALYDHISSFDWCVRGDVARATFEGIVKDRRPGESFISADYESASDRIYPWATRVMVDALLEDENLTSEERRVLVESFENLSWVSKAGTKHPITRGQMMGSLVGFPLLCLLNKACFDISCDIFYGPPSKGQGYRVGRFNGDDCAFSGSATFFSLWREVTSTFGLVVNEEKTGFDSRWIELNSNVFDVRFGSMIAKPVLSFLRTERYTPDDLLPEIIRGVSTLRPDVRMWVVNDLMRHEVSIRRINVQGLSKHWMRILIKKKWFRLALVNPPEVREKGVDRSAPVVLGPVPKPELLESITSLAMSETQSYVRYWRGRKVQPLERRLIRRPRKGVQKNPFPKVRVAMGRPKWRFLWPAGLLETIMCDGFLSRNAFISSEEHFLPEVTDHPFLSLEWTFVSKRRSFFPALYTHVRPPQTLLQGVKRPPARPFELDGGINLWSARQGKRRRGPKTPL
jgi:hypothetical protein